MEICCTVTDVLTESFTTHADRRTWAGLSVLMLPVLLVTIAHTSLYFALPVIATDLHPTASVQLWLIDAYPLILCSLLVAGGNVGDRLGRRRTLILGMCGFALSSLTAAFAPNAEFLLGARIAMGVFGALILPATHSLLRSMFEDRKQRRLAIAIWSTGFAAGAALGPMIGGALVQMFGWPAVFLPAVPFAAVLAVGAPLLISESRDPDPGRLDLWSIVLSALTLAPIVAAIKHAVDSGPDATVWALFVLGATAGTLFVRRMLTASNPMLDLRLLRRAGFSGAVLINLISVATMTWFMFYAAQHLQLVAGLTPLRAAWILVPGAVANILAGLAVVRLVRFARPATVMGTGLLFSAMAYSLIAVVGGDTTITAICLVYVLVGIGIGSAETLTNDLMLANIPPEKAGSATAVSETAYELGTVLGVTVLGGILTAAYRVTLDVPTTLDPGDAETARDTLAGAVDTAGTLPDPTASTLVTASHTAFEAGAFMTSLVCAGLMFVTALTAFTVLRRESA